MHATLYIYLLPQKCNRTFTYHFPIINQINRLSQTLLLPDYFMLKVELRGLATISQTYLLELDTLPNSLFAKTSFEIFLSINM
jgi:hypothetical protein